MNNQISDNWLAESFKHTRTIFCLLILTTCCLTTNPHAAETGEVIFKNLPPEPHIYVNGKSVSPVQDKVHLAQGEHEIQIEGTRGEGIVAFRRKVQVRPNEALVIPITPLPVHIASPFHGGPIARFTIGPTGLPGPRGPGGEPASKTIQADAKTLQPLINAALQILLADMEGQFWRIRYYAGADRPQSYWYDPSGIPGPVAPSGPMGPPGPSGIAGDTLLLQVDDEQLLLDILKEYSGLKSIEQSLNDLQVTAKALQSSRPPVDTKTFNHWLMPISILTPDLKQRLDNIYKEVEHKLATIPLMGPPGQVGKAGPPGPRGEDGKTTGAAPIYLSPVQTQQLIASVNEDEALRERVEKLKSDLETLKDLMPQPEIRYEIK